MTVNDMDCLGHWTEERAVDAGYACYDVGKEVIKEKTGMRKTLLLLALSVMLPVSAQCGSIDDLSTYAVMLGRGAACNASIDGPTRRVGAWIDRTWSGQEKSAMTMAFMVGMENAAKLQAKGQSPDSCDKVREVILTTQWP